MTVNLPNWSSKKEVQIYEAAFGDHNCGDSNYELIVIETGGFFKLHSCGNNLVKFEDFEWWNGDGDFSTGEQQWFLPLLDYISMNLNILQTCSQ